eukprot:TRINITY_DN42568_c0_g1_i2.p1 TRINITY_DN42568_c0_g1~~TRINITY_DN42568_c0_g1_i2.p1  ORF type:complete len:138 (-),score=15.27 TRINITY_DN42568_c0_g1_i2:11-391(-)
MTKITLTSKCQKECESNHDPYGFNFTMHDIDEMGVRVKHMSLLDYAQGKILLNQVTHVSQSLDGAGKDLTARAAGRLLDLAMHSFSNVLRSDTLNMSASQDQCLVKEIGRAVQQECRDRSRMPSSA